MPITVACTNCGSQLKLEDESEIGKKVACPECHRAFVVTVPPTATQQELPDLEKFSMDRGDAPKVNETVDDPFGTVDLAPPRADLFGGDAGGAEGGDEADPLDDGELAGESESGAPQPPPPGGRSGPEILMVGVGVIMALGAVALVGVGLWLGFVASFDNAGDEVVAEAESRDPAGDLAPGTTGVGGFDTPEEAWEAYLNAGGYGLDAIPPDEHGFVAFGQLGLIRYVVQFAALDFSASELVDTYNELLAHHDLTDKLVFDDEPDNIRENSERAFEGVDIEQFLADIEAFHEAHLPMNGPEDEPATDTTADGEPELRDLAIDGNEATATEIGADGSERQVVLVRQDGRWYYSYFRSEMLTAKPILVFDGRSSVTAGRIPFDRLDSFTIEAWVRGWHGPIVSQGTAGDPENSVWLATGMNGRNAHLASGWEYGRGSNIQTAFGPWMNPLDWNHVAMVYDGQLQQFFVNGELVESRQAPKPGPLLETRPLTIGVHNNESSSRPAIFGAGLLGPMRISSEARYGDSFTPTWEMSSDGDTVLNFDMSEGSGNRLRDSSGEDRNGVITGARWASSDQVFSVNLED